jgi:hypothetical protein
MPLHPPTVNDTNITITPQLQEQRH